MNYDELLDISHVPTLENRRLFLCLCTFYNIIHGFVFFPPHLLPNLCNTRTNYSLTYNIPFAHTTSLQHSFLHTVLHFWNYLPEKAVSASSLSSFKYYSPTLFITYNIYIIQVHFHIRNALLVYSLSNQFIKKLLNYMSCLLCHSCHHCLWCHSCHHCLLCHS